MAKSSKPSFRTSVAEYERLRSEISHGKVAPLYLLMGEEGYFIDRLTELVSAAALTEEQRTFNQIVVYGRDTDEGTVINYARQLPMMGGRQLVVVREAQQLRRIDRLAVYTANPSPSTVLVICYKGKSVDKRTQFYKQTAATGIVYESLRPRDYEIAGWLSSLAASKGCSITPEALNMLTDHLGTDLSKISNELDKLLTFLPAGTRVITADHVERNTGISKEFNNFELTKALSERNMPKALLIAGHFERNPKDNPLTVTISTLFSHFRRIFLLNYRMWQARHRNMPAPDDTELCRLLGLSSPYFLGEYKRAAAIYPNKKVFAILGHIRQYDMRSKGLGGSDTGDGQLLRELLLKIMLA